nr:hypothetical protein [Tanacetum cinerariifolium]
EARDYMEIGLREWLIVIGIIVIAGILFDGWRRMRGGKGKLKFRLDRSFSNLPDDEEGSSAENILESGLRFGEMDIFHRHESMAGNGEVLFSMANAVKPGVFDLDDIDHFSTRAVSFFLGLPGPRHPKQAFDVMVAAA